LVGASLRYSQASMETLQDNAILYYTLIYIYFNMLLYTSLPTIMAALHRITSGHSNLEHTTSTATSGLLQHYYPITRFITTPPLKGEIHLTTELGGYKKPDYTVETLDGGGGLLQIVFVEVKSLVNSNFNSILDQLYDTILQTVDIQGGSFSVFVIAMKGSKIAILHFSSCVSELDINSIPRLRRGFTPINYILTADQWRSIYSNPDQWHLYSEYLNTFNIPDAATLVAQGVEITTKIPYPHIFNLLEINHHSLKGSGLYTWIVPKNTRCSWSSSWLV